MPASIPMITSLIFNLLFVFWFILSPIIFAAIRDGLDVNVNTLGSPILVGPDPEVYVNDAAFLLTSYAPRHHKPPVSE